MKMDKSSYYVYKVVYYIENSKTQRNLKGLYSGYDLVLFTTLIFH